MNEQYRNRKLFFRYQRLSRSIVKNTEGGIVCGLRFCLENIFWGSLKKLIWIDLDDS